MPAVPVCDTGDVDQLEFDPAQLVAGQLVGVRFRKWNGRRHWHGDVRYLGRDDYGYWFGSALGTHWARPGLEFDQNRWQVVLVPDPQGEADLPLGCSPSFYTADGPPSQSLIYVDIATPPQWVAGDPVEVRAVDLDLDVIRRIDGEVLVDDESEFDEHRVQLGYPDELVRAARADCAWVLQAVHDQAEPFGRVWRGWLAQFIKDSGRR